jgi:hypothetical protein
VSRQVWVKCQWAHDGNTAYDGKLHLGTLCPSCGNPIQGSAMATLATLADPLIEAKLALAEAVDAADRDGLRLDLSSKVDAALAALKALEDV